MGDLYIRNIVFGIADSLISTVGLLSGIDIAGKQRSVIVLTGVVYAFVEAFSMAVGGFLSEESIEQYQAKGNAHGRRPLRAGVIMFLSFLLASFIPLFPYLTLSISLAFWFSIALSLVTLFIMGLITANVSGTPPLRRALKMMLLGGAAIVLGVVVGKFVHVE